MEVKRRKMPLYDLLEKRLGEAEKYIKEDSKARGALKMIGSIKVNIKTTDTNEGVGATISSNGVELFKEAIEGPAITISGTSKVLTDLIRNPDRAKLDEAQRKEQIKLESHGLKGKLVMSKVKDLLSA
jgi:hypothetical protein